MKPIKSLIMLGIVILCSINSTFAQTNISPADSNQIVTIKVKGVTCSGDLKTIAMNVEKLTGVTQCKTGKMGATSTFEVKYNPSKVSLKAIYTAIENTQGCENPNDRPYKVKL